MGGGSLTGAPAPGSTGGLSHPLQQFRRKAPRGRVAPGTLSAQRPRLSSLFSSASAVFIRGKRFFLDIIEVSFGSPAPASCLCFSRGRQPALEKTGWCARPLPTRALPEGPALSLRGSQHLPLRPPPQAGGLPLLPAPPEAAHALGAVQALLLMLVPKPRVGAAGGRPSLQRFNALAALPLLYLLQLLERTVGLCPSGFLKEALPWQLDPTSPSSSG